MADESKVWTEKLDGLRLLTMEEVLQVWPINRSYLSLLTNHPNDELRIPSYKLGRRKLYSPAELMWYREKHRFVPKRRRATPV